MTTLADLCPQCGSDDYGPLDLAYPFDLPEHNPNPNVSYVVGVCCACGHLEDDAEAHPQGNGCLYCTGSTNPDLRDHMLNVHPNDFGMWAYGRDFAPLAAARAAEAGDDRG